MCGRAAAQSTAEQSSPAAIRPVKTASGHDEVVATAESTVGGAAGALSFTSEGAFHSKAELAEKDLMLL